jgi:hypothetical protein
MRAIIGVIVALLLVTGCASMAPQARREEYVKTHNVDTVTEQRIMEGKIAVGMTDDEVRASWGEPRDINRTVTEYGVREQWVYGSYTYISDNTYLYFEDGVLTGWQD